MLNKICGSCFYQKYPEYYQIIKQPIDLKMIAERVQEGVYTTLDDMEKDFNLLVKNAKTFNEPKSQIYKVCGVFQLDINLLITL